MRPASGLFRFGGTAATPAAGAWKGPRRAAAAGSGRGAYEVKDPRRGLGTSTPKGRMGALNLQDTVTQFTAQVDRFVTSPHVNEPEPVHHFLAAVSPRGDERALDVACGPGLLAKTFAPHVR